MSKEPLYPHVPRSKQPLFPYMPEGREMPMTQDTIDYLAKTEGDPIRKFCCRQCGECAPPELLEEGRFPDRMEWLRKHYSQFHRREFAEWGQRK